MLIVQTLYFFFSGPTSIVLQRPKGTDKLVQTREVLDKAASTFLGMGVVRNRIMASIALAAGLIAYTAQQQENYLLSSFVGVTVIAFYSNLVVPRVSTRALTKISMLMLVSVHILAVLILPLRAEKLISRVYALW